jgi:putative Mg2+ transporter-C (MgtC) family protein
MEVAHLPGYINGDPGRVAAQVVTWIWFIWAGAIMKMWMNTKGLTTAANIWVTSAIWLIVWVWLYAVAIIATFLMLFNLIVITKIKRRIVKQFRYCHIRIEFQKKKMSEKKIINMIKTVPINVLTKDIKENQSHIIIKIVSKINKNIDIYKIHSELEKLRKIDKMIKISIAENIK